VELANILDMYFEDQFTLPGKTFYSNWNSEPSKIKKNNGYLNNLFALLAGSSIVFLVGAIAQLCWPQSLKDKRLATVSSCVSSSQSYCSDIHSLDSSEVCFLVLEMLLLAQGESCLFLSVETLWYFILFSGFFFT
jgi:hypothetical protein